MSTSSGAIEVTPVYDNDENKERGNWSNKFDFMLSAIGAAVGLGNIWRFPFRAYQNGGASFLVPYVITLVLAGLPLFFFEMALGQFASLGTISIWKAVPLMKGIGWSMVVISFMLAIYYNMVIAYILRYLFASFTATLPWQHCRPDWVPLYNCYERIGDAVVAGNDSRLLADNSTTTDETVTIDDVMVNFSNENTTSFSVARRSPAEIYWQYEVLGLSHGIDAQLSDIKWDLVLCLLLAWLIVFFCNIKGIKSSGKVVYFTALAPYVVLFILVIWNARLEGAWLGIKFYVVPEWRKLANAKVWYSAGTQIFFSLGIGYGNIGMMSSYNRFHDNVYRNAIIVTVINCATSVFGGFAIFSVIGFMATKTGLPIDKVVAGGPGLAFVAYPEGLSMMPVAPLWSILFFLMLLTLGVDSQFATVETVVTAIVDEFPVLRSPRRKMVVIGLSCSFMFLLGLPQCSRAGIYVVTLLDNYSCALNVIVIGFLELAAISWIYGVRRFCEDICMMIGHKPNYYWIVCWAAVGPLLMIFLVVFSIVDYSSSSYGEYLFPKWADGIGWLIFAGSLLIVPLTGLYEFIQARRRCAMTSVRQVFRHLLRPAPDWGPALVEFRTGRYANSVTAGSKATVWTSCNDISLAATSTNSMSSSMPVDHAESVVDGDVQPA